MSRVVVVALTLFLSGCLKNPLVSTRCDEIDTDETGVLAEDLVGTWAAWGIDSPVYAVFEADGAARWVEAPNMYAPNGLQWEGTWAVDGDVLSFDGDTGGLRVAIDDDVLVELGEDTGDAGREHPRVACRGYGF